MKRYITVLVLVVFLVSTSLLGCNKTSIKVPENSIPFFAIITNSDSNKVAYLSYWNLTNGKITKTDKIVYTVSPFPPPTDKANMAVAFYGDSFGYGPVYWNGKDVLILPSFFQSSVNLYNHTEILSIVDITGQPDGLGTPLSMFGKDVEMIRITNEKAGDYRYTVKLWNGKEYIEKELDLNYIFSDTNYKTGYPIAIDNEETKLNILVCGGYNPRTGMDLFLCTVDKKDWTTKWSKISVNEDAHLSPSNPPLPSNSIYFDGSFYLPAGCCIVGAKVDIDTLICSEWKVKLPPNLFPKASNEEGPILHHYLGSYNDMIIIQKNSVKDCYIYLINENGEAAGVMHLTYENGNLETLDKDGNILSKIILGENSSLVFPKPNGTTS